MPTFGSVADGYIAAQASRFKSAKHLAQWKMTLGDAYCSAIRSLPVDAIGVQQVLDVLTPVWGSRPETASRIRGRIETVLDAARVAGHRSGENPARWRGNLRHLLPKPPKLSRGHFAALPVDDLPAFMAKLMAKNSVSASCLAFTILACVRTSEAIGAPWTEIDGDVWTIPAERMKGQRDQAREHRVPLTEPVMAILERMRKLERPWVFPGQHDPRRHLSNMAMLELLRDMKVPVTVHGFRSTFRDWAGDRTSFPEDLIEGALAHVIVDKTKAAYRRSDALERRRKLMSAWAGYCLSGAESNVIRPRFGRG